MLLQKLVRSTVVSIAPAVKVHVSPQYQRAVEYPETILTRSSMVEDLLSAGVKHGDILCVHTSLSSLGLVIGGARTVVEALIEAVGVDGTLMMPTYSGDLSDPKEWAFPPVPEKWYERIRRETPPYDPRLTPTRKLGVVPELFRHYPGVIRSDHPQSSCAALGPAAETLTSEHSLDFRFGPKSPLGRLAELEGRTLLLGAPADTASVLYVTQFKVGRLKPIRKSAPMLVDGEVQWVNYEDTEYSATWFPAAINLLLEMEIAKEGTVGRARTIIFDVAPAIEAVSKWRREEGL